MYFGLGSGIGKCGGVRGCGTFSIACCCFILNCVYLCLQGLYLSLRSCSQANDNSRVRLQPREPVQSVPNVPEFSVESYSHRERY